MMCRITLHLARSAEHPEGSGRHGYELLAPLDSTGHLDAESWKQFRDYCRVRRFWAGDGEQQGRLVHRAGGAGGATWVIDYDDSSAADDEAAYRLGSHIFAPGEYVSIRDVDGPLHTFVVKAVEPVRLAEPART